VKFEPIAAYLESRISTLKQGRNLFIDQMPLDIDLGMLLKETPTGTEMNWEIIGRRRGKFQMVVRCKNYLAGSTLINQAMNLLILDETLLGKIHVRYMRPLNEPVSYMLSVGNNYEFSVNFSAIYDIVAT